MTLADFASLSAAISGIAVTASLIYLALQVHQNTKHTRAFMLQGRTSRLVDLQIATSNADIAAANIVAHGGKPTPEEIQRRQFRAIWGAYIANMEETFWQHRNGLIEEDAYQAFRDSIRYYLSQPGNRAEWSRRKALAASETPFIKFIDELISTLPSAPTNQTNATA